MRNPYTPGAGLQPPYLAGREGALRKVRRANEAIQAAQGTSPITITGLRGMGKTALLGHIGDLLAAEGWLSPPVARFSRTRNLEKLWMATRSNILRMQPKTLLLEGTGGWSMDSMGWKAGGKIGMTGLAASGELSGTLSPKKAREMTRETIYEDLVHLGEAAKENSIEVLLRFDEAQEAPDDDLSVLVEIGQMAGERKWPLLLIFAGLGPLRTKLAKTGTFATRFPGIEAGALSDSESEAALSVPATDQSVVFEQAALDAAIDFSRGVPYHIQMIGQESWEESAVRWEEGRSCLITLDAVQRAIPHAIAEIATAMYQPLWSRATAGEQGYLTAMAMAPWTKDGISVKDVLVGLDKDHEDTGFLRQRLIDKGLIHGVRYGLVEFSYPGFDEYAREQKAITIDSIVKEQAALEEAGEGVEGGPQV